MYGAERTLQLLYCKAGEQPNAAMRGFWQSMSDCLTELAIHVD